MKRDNLAFAEGPDGLRHQQTRFTVHRRKQEAGVSREEHVSGREGECCGIVTLAILCSVEQISNRTTCIFPSGRPKSQTAKGHLWKRLHGRSEKKRSGVCRSVSSGQFSDASFVLPASVSECDI